MSGLENLLDRLGSYLTSNLPTLLTAIGILVGGWLVARIAAYLLRKGLSKTEVDDRIAAWVTGGKSTGEGQVEYWASRSLFYLLMLFVLVAFFQTLGLAAITGPLNTFLNEVFAYLPRLLGSAFLAGFAFLVATALRWAVRKALEAVDLDQRFADRAGAEGEQRALPLSQTLSEAVYWLVFLLFLPAILSPLGLDSALGKQRLSSLLGTVVYVLVLIPVLIASLEALAIESVTRPASEMLNTVLLSIPHLFAAALVLTVAYFVGKVVGGLVTNLLGAAGFDSLPSRLGLAKSDAPAGTSLSQLAGTLVLVAVMLFAATEAARLLGFDAVGELVSQFTVFAGQLLLGVIIFGVGLFVADVAARTIRASSAREAGLLAMAARVAILVLTGAMALRRMGLANEIINLAFGLTLGAVAVALALAFGLGARDAAADQVQKWRKRLNSGSGSE